MTSSFDVVVIGGGVIGSAVSYFASKRGLKVLLVDQPRRGRATSASAGGLWPIGESMGLGCGVIFHRTHASSHPVNDPSIGSMPRDFFDFSMRSGAMFPSLSESLLEATSIDIELDRSSLLFVMYDESDVRFGRSVQERCPNGDQWIETLSRDELALQEPAVSSDCLGALRFRGDDQVNPYLFSIALVEAAKHYGASVLSNAQVVAITMSENRVTGVETDQGDIACESVVNAAGSWASEVGKMVGLEVPIRPVRGQILGTHGLPPRTLSACLSTSECYLLQKRHGEVIVGSTTEEVGFDPRVTESAMKTLAAGAVRAVPALARCQVKRTWSGFRPGTPDELPIIGPVASVAGYWNACGHFRTGIVNAPLTGLILAELLSGEKPSFPIAPFAFDRPSLSKPAWKHDFLEMGES